MIIIKIKKEDALNRIDKFLINLYPNLNNIDIFKNIKKNNIKVNGTKVKHSYVLKIDDEIKIYFNPEIKSKINILFEDENILLIIKPNGIPCVDEKSKQDLLSLVRNQFKELYDDKYLINICNRLDTNTSGIVIFTKNIHSFNSMNELIKNREIRKFYKVLVYGHMEKKEAILTNWLIKDSKNSFVHISNKEEENSKLIETKYKAIKSYKKYSLLDVELLTGRTHQIRAHFNYIKHPIVGEKKYITKEFEVDTRFKNQALVSYKVRFEILNELDFLHYLNKKEFLYKDIWFEKLL